MRCNAYFFKESVLEVRKIKKVSLILFMLLSVIGILYSAISIYKTTNQYKVSADKYQEIERIYYKEDESEDRYQKLLMLNSDFIGWLEIDQTKISYPVVRTEDNDFYLSRNFYNETDKSGAIFMDFRNNPNKLDKNTIIYGHNMKDGSMFGSLKAFLDQNFLEEQNKITFSSSDSTYIWEVFSVYEAEDVAWMGTKFTDLRDYEKFLDRIINKSVIDRETVVDSTDKILTLATCTTSDKKRLVIHAKLVNREDI